LIPIRDANRSKTIPHITRILILANVFAFIPFLFYTFFSENPSVSLFANWIYDSFAMVPDEIIRGENLHTLFTSLFLHADIFHIGGNMLYLYIFGDNIEDRLGHLRFLLFYFVCGIVADFAHILSVTSTAGLYIPTLGASGAISGVMGAYILLYPRARIETLTLTFVITIVSVPAVFFLGFWFILQLLYTWLGMGGNVAYGAHIGGFVAGMILGLIAKRKRKPKPEIPYYREIRI
jgi:membrane associated rhomboid family serine protease